MRKIFFFFMTLVMVNTQLFAEPTKTREETINCTMGSLEYLTDAMGMCLVFGYNTDSTRQVCLGFKVRQLEVGNYLMADSTFDTESSFVAYSSKVDLKTTNLFNVISGNFNVSVNQTGDAIVVGTMLAIDKKNLTDVPEFTITIPLKIKINRR